MDSKINNALASAQAALAKFAAVRKNAGIEGEITPANVKLESDEGLQIEDTDEGQNRIHTPTAKAARSQQ